MFQKCKWLNWRTKSPKPKVNTAFSNVQLRERGNKPPPVSEQWFMPGSEYVGIETIATENKDVARTQITIGIWHADVEASLVKGYLRLKSLSDDDKMESQFNCSGNIIDNRKHFFTYTDDWKGLDAFNELTRERQTGFVEQSKRHEASTLTSFSDTLRTPAIFVKWNVFLASDDRSSNPQVRIGQINRLKCYHLCFKASQGGGKTTSIEALGQNQTFELQRVQVAIQTGRSEHIFHELLSRCIGRESESSEDTLSIRQVSEANERIA